VRAWSVLGAADAGLFAVVDTPGADAVGAVGEAEKEEAWPRRARPELASSCGPSHNGTFGAPSPSGDERCGSSYVCRYHFS
jgi:hypothetical protein